MDKKFEPIPSDNLLISGVNSRLQDVRNYYKITQKNLAKVLNKSQQEYSRMESGGYVVQLDDLLLLAMFYNLSLDFLTGLIDDPKPLYSKFGTVNGINIKDIAKDNI